MKPNSKNKTQFGFTLVEMLVVIAILSLMAALVTVNFNKQRALRSVTLAQNETVTNARKVQSYTLSSREIRSNLPADYYVLTFRTKASGFDNNDYSITAIDENFFGYTVETVKLPEGVYVSAIESGDTGVKPDAYDCVQIAFGAPFGQMFVNQGGCEDEIQNTLFDPVTRMQATNKTVTITLSNSQTATAKQIIFYGFSGRIEPY